MKGKRFTEQQIIAVLKESEAGAKTKDLCRKHGISDATFYNWKARFGGMTVSEARRLKELEAENAKLKRLLADAELDKAAENGRKFVDNDFLGPALAAGLYVDLPSSSGVPNSLARCSCHARIAGHRFFVRGET